MGFARIFPIAAIVAAIFSVALPSAQAQTQSPPTPAVLTQIDMPDSKGDPQIVLTFTPMAPKFSIVKNNDTSTSVGFASSSRADSARMPPDLHGLVRGISFQQADSVLIVRIDTTAAVRLSVSQISSNALAITVSAASSGSSGTMAAGNAPAQANAPLAPFNLPPQDQSGFEVVPLKYADVSEVVGLLGNGAAIKPNDSFTPDQPNFGSAGLGSTGTYSPPPPVNLDQQNMPWGQSIDQAIGVDRRLNAIILKGSPELIARLKAEIENIDVPVKSVILETTFVELNRTGAHNVGLDFNNANSQIGVSSFQLGQFSPPGFPLTHGLSSLSLQAAIYAQVSQGNGRIISKPRIAAQSGSEAKIITGDQLPILTSITLSGVNGVSQQVQYVNVGVTLQIAPRVSNDGFVTSHVFCVVSSVTGYSQGYPTISQRKAETSVTVQDGEAFTIGGLTQENRIENNNKIPLLGDIPLLSEVFDTVKNTDAKTELYIVVTPHIMTAASNAIAAATVSQMEAGQLQTPPETKAER